MLVGVDELMIYFIKFQKFFGSGVKFRITAFTLLRVDICNRNLGNGFKDLPEI